MFDTSHVKSSVVVKYLCRGFNYYYSVIIIAFFNELQQHFLSISTEKNNCVIVLHICAMYNLA